MCHQWTRVLGLGVAIAIAIPVSHSLVDDGARAQLEPRRRRGECTTEDCDFFANIIDARIQPDHWEPRHQVGALSEFIKKIPTNGDPPEQLVKVTDRRHRFPVFATICSLAFLITIVVIIIVLTH